MKETINGICAAKGFRANGIHCGIRKNKTKKDLCLIVSETLCSAASCYTQNHIQGAPLHVTKQHLKNGTAQAIIVNSGNANTCNANGIEIANDMCELVATELSIDKSDVIVASTGVIGEKLAIDPIKKHIPQLVAGLSKKHSSIANEAILTTDTKTKECAVTFDINGTTCTIGGIAKGSGMIHPNMATMLAFVTSDVAITSELLQTALSDVVEDTFNMVSVDGDTSTNDMVSILCNGLANNVAIKQVDESYLIFKEALTYILKKLSIAIAQDGEGASKLLTCHVQKATSKKDAAKIAKAVIASSLVKTAMFGNDANWGRVLCAIGYAKATYNPHTIDVTFISTKGSIQVCSQSTGCSFDEDLATIILSEKEVIIDIHLGDGDSEATAWGCDLTYDYVKINGDYRT